MQNLPKKTQHTPKFLRSRSRPDFIYSGYWIFLKNKPIVTNFRQDQSLHKFRYRFMFVNSEKRTSSLKQGKSNFLNFVICAGITDFCTGLTSKLHRSRQMRIENFLHLYYYPQKQYKCNK